MEALRIEILNQKALKFIRGLQELNLIKVSEEPETKAQIYLKKMRRNSKVAPSLVEINKIVKQVRSERYAKK